MNTVTEPRNGIRLEARGPVGMLVLSRPETLNALTIDMVLALSEGLRKLESDNAIKMIIISSDSERAFCAGGDMKQIRQHALNGDHEAIRHYFTNEYALNLSIAKCRKPYLALIDGIAMGGGLGVSVHGQYRVVTEKAVMAMPESRIGFFPDVGASWFLPRLPLRCGYWLGLTSASVKGIEAVETGLATHHVASDALDSLLDALQAALQDDDCSSCDEACRVVEQVLASETSESESSGDSGSSIHEESNREAQRQSFQQILTQRAHWFADDDLTAIRARLQQDTEHSTDAKLILSLLDSASPHSLDMTLSLFRQTHGLELEDCLQLELQLAQEACRHPDLVEGVRAVLVDKDRTPHWSQ
ncbi:enoyl-CoA hydratase/isomerase family protein [Granulosicoccus sp. 3-233]|uniref:enoyl-CoA hydratase/isomerase family protein n=1 Tax=Granulosicoccus sp. 3-233 TaxID=3417969 RepID=UPI003D32E203